jgi:hypothetical protein
VLHQHCSVFLVAQLDRSLKAAGCAGPCTQQVWIQTARVRDIRALAVRLWKIEVDKDDVGFPILQIEAIVDSTGVAEGDGGEEECAGVFASSASDSDSD